MSTALLMGYTPDLEGEKISSGRSHDNVLPRWDTYTLWVSPSF